MEKSESKFQGKPRTNHVYCKSVLIFSNPLQSNPFVRFNKNKLLEKLKGKTQIQAQILDSTDLKVLCGIAIQFLSAFSCFYTYCDPDLHWTLEHRLNFLRCRERITSDGFAT